MIQGISPKRMIAGAAVGALLTLSLPAGAARTSVTYAPAVIERALDAKVRTAKPTQVFDIVVSGWSRSALKALDRLGVRHRKLQVLPMAFARLTPAQIIRLRASDGIRGIYGERKLDLYLNESTHIIQARETAKQLGVDGTGATIAVIDTGVDALHPDVEYGTKVLNNYEVLSPGIFDPGSPLLVDEPNTDDDGHGTHTSSTVAGSGASSPEGKDYSGVAPGAKLIVYSANQGPTLLVTHTIAAFDHILATKDETHVRAVSNSWGGGTGLDLDPNDPLEITFETLYRNNILAVFAAGNSGTAGDTTPDGSNTLGQECVSPYVVCVAAATKHRQVATFSSRGRPNGIQDRALALKYNLGVYRPTVAAPGVDIVAPAALSGAADDRNPPWGYQSLSGTSMACPHVAGVVALMVSANPKLTPAQIIEILEGTADPMAGWDAHDQGAGMVNAKKAVEAALALKAGRKPALSVPSFDYTAPARTAKTLTTLEGSTIPLQFTHGAGVETKEFTVPASVERLHIDLDWSTQAENLYGFVWGPGQTPNEEDPQDEPYPVQESWGLLCDTAGLTDGPCMLTHRNIDVTYPQPGIWKLRVYARTAGLSYTATVKAFTYAMPKLDITSTGSMLKGVANFPLGDRTPRDFGVAVGTPLLNPTMSPTTVYFHGSSPSGNADVASGTDPTWDGMKPEGSTPKMATALPGLAEDTNTNATRIAHFSKVLDRPIEGGVIVSFWASSATALQSWSIGILSGDNGENVVATADASMVTIPLTPQRFVILVPNVRIPAKTKMIVQIANALSPHTAVLYDSADMPSGIVLPEVARLNGSTGTATVEALVGRDLRNGAISLTWARTPNAKAYNVYGGVEPTVLKLLRTVTAGTGAAKAPAPFVAEGTIVAGNPGTQVGAGVTENDLVLECTDDLLTQGTDGYVIKLPKGAGDGLQKIAVVGDGPGHDLDLQFWSEDCSSNVGDIASESPDESGTIPKGAAWLVVNLWSGAAVPFTATVTLPAAGGQVETLIGSVPTGRSYYLRVAAVDAKGKEGRATDIITMRPTSFERAIEVSRDGMTWTAIPADVAAKAAKAAFSIAGGAAAKLAGLTSKGKVTMWVRARAGHATSAPAKVEVLASGAVAPRPVVKKPVLAATGIGTGSIGVVFLAIAGAVATWKRRIRSA